MARDPEKFKLGVFVLCGLVLLLATGILLGAGKWYREQRTLYCYFEENVSGLEKGNPVRYRGVAVGVVESVRLVTPKEGAIRPGAPIEVQCSIFPEQFGARGMLVLQDDFAIDVDVMVARGLRASLAIKDITLSKYIALEFYPPSQQPIRSLGIDTKRPYVPTAVEASFADIQRDLASTLGQLAHVKYEEISNRLVDLLEVLTQRIEVVDTQALAGHAEETLVAVRRLAEDPVLHRVIQRLDTISERAEHVVVRADEIASGDELRETLESTRAATRSIAAAAERLESELPRILERVDGLVASAQHAVEESDVAATSASIRGAADSVGDAARDFAAMREEMRRSLADFGRASRSIERLARLLEENPAALLAGKARQED